MQIFFHAFKIYELTYIGTVIKNAFEIARNY